MPEFFEMSVDAGGRSETGVVLVRTRFGSAGTNAEIVPDAIAAWTQLGLKGGRGIKFNGPMSIACAFAIAHAVGHLYGWVACWDPKIERYVAVISHDPDVRPGQLLE